MTRQLTAGATFVLTRAAQVRGGCFRLEGDRKRLEIANTLQSLALRKALARDSLRKGLCTGSPAAYAAALDNLSAGAFPAASRVASPVGATPLPPTPHAY